eukprot:IDg4685t1
MKAANDAEVQKQLEYFTKELGLERPTRSAVDAERPWVRGVPNYDSADLEFLRGRSRNHSAGTVESIVENLVKQWEMEASHLRYKDWRTVSHDNYHISANGARRFAGADGAETGNYNALLTGIDPALYDAEKHTFETSHSLFRDAFPRGFPWELLEVLAGPPRVVFSWRHWAHFTGNYKGRAGDDRLHELYGVAAVSLNAAGKITEIEVYYKPEDFLRALEGKISPEALRSGASIFGKGDPIAGIAPRDCSERLNENCRSNAGKLVPIVTM